MTRLSKPGDGLGSPESPQEYWYCSPGALNDQGQVVWNRYERSAVIWRRGKKTDIGTLGGKQSFAVAINNRGQVVGSSYTTNGTLHAFVWENGDTTDLGRSGEGPSKSNAVAINDKGQIVGYSQTGAPGGGGYDPPSHAVLWTLPH